MNSSHKSKASEWLGAILLFGRISSLKKTNNVSISYLATKAQVNVLTKDILRTLKVDGQCI